jgi:hypothetical protein
MEDVHRKARHNSDSSSNDFEQDSMPESAQYQQADAEELRSSEPD